MSQPAKKKVKRKFKPSSGKRYQHKARKEICRLQMKINRWKRYAKENKCNWSTEGLEKQLSFYKNRLTNSQKSSLISKEK